MQLALVHRSASRKNNEILEFLGDSVLQLAVTTWLVGFYPGETEGFYAATRAQYVCKDNLYRVGQRLGVPSRLILGRSEECSGGRSKASIIEGAVEAMIGAIYTDYGWQKAYDWIAINILATKPHA
jgi:ribonuclease-3